MAALVYYLFAYPLSLLPLRWLYLLSDAISFLFKNILPYRRKVIIDNLRLAFPQKSESEIKALCHAYYDFLADVLIESIKNFSFSAQDIHKHFSPADLAELERLKTINKPIILVSSHFNNWEWLISATALWFDKPCFGIGMPLSADFWDKKLTQKRERFGLKVVHQDNYKLAFEKKNPVLLVLADQAPASAEKAYWTNFLGIASPIIFGPEYLANAYDCAVVYVNIKNCKRGFYNVSFEVINEDAKQLEYGQITEKHASFLETAIAQDPSRWLWSHKRWKRQAPADLNTLKMQSKARFEERFRK
jgi:KDO2-lipid IV(A) lauroyltransferase